MVDNSSSTPRYPGNWQVWTCICLAGSPHNTMVDPKPAANNKYHIAHSGIRVKDAETSVSSCSA